MTREAAMTGTVHRDSLLHSHTTEIDDGPEQRVTGIG